MTERDFELILINGLVHTPETRIDFYLNEATKNNIEPVNFYIGLSKAYERLYEYVTSTDGRAWTENEKGEKSYIKNTLDLYQFTGGKLRGNISEKNITELLLPYLYKMGKAIKTNIEKQYNPPNQIKGFQSKLTDNKIKSLYKNMQETYFNTDYKNFEAMLTGKECYPITWTYKNNKGGVNQTALVAFIETILKQTKKVSKTHFNTEITSGIKKDMYYSRYVVLFSEMIE